MKMKNKPLFISILVLTLIILMTVSLGCELQCTHNHKLQVINDAGNSLPIHASIEGGVGSGAPKIEPGSSHTFEIPIREEMEMDAASVSLTISRNEEILSVEHIMMGSRNVTATVYEAITGGIVTQVE